MTLPFRKRHTLSSVARPRAKLLCMRAVLLCFTIACLPAFGQLTVRINDAPPVTLSADDLAKLPPHTAVLNDHGKQITYQGALLQDILAHAGFDFGKRLHGAQLSSYVTALASDGYEVLYALADFDPTVVDSDVIVASKRDGGPLAANEGALRIIVPHDKRPTRSIRMLKEIDVVQLKK